MRVFRVVKGGNASYKKSENSHYSCNFFVDSPTSMSVLCLIWVFVVVGLVMVVVSVMVVMVVLVVTRLVVAVLVVILV